MNLAITIILGTAVVLLAMAAAIAVERIAAGPSQLDRSISSDLLVAVVIAAVGVWAVANHQDTEIAMILLLSMLGFTGAISVARMVAERVVHRRSEDKQKEARK
ncbi:MAG: monovalent cation/H+ antiporter complex subunit F [Propionibacteriaceae bacterium]|nr:monovalent cation/H+ antiporter complex subunit F [Propionibacteriaceae bacterium]